MKKRAQRTIIIIAGFLIAGLLYGMFFSVTGIGVPCLFRTITGFLCPGCGITHMCVALMEGDIPKAIQSNSVIFFLLPFILYLLAVQLFWYIKTGTMKVSKRENIMAYVMIVILVGYGIVRNL